MVPIWIGSDAQGTFLAGAGAFLLWRAIVWAADGLMRAVVGKASSRIRS